MNQYSWSNCPQGIRTQVQRLLADLQTTLGVNLVGVYLHGSLATGHFNPERSDIDLLAITRDGMAAETKRQIAQLILRGSNDPRPVEITFLRKRDLEYWQHPSPFDFHYSERWRKKYEEDQLTDQWKNWGKHAERDPDLATQIAMTLGHGICLQGAPAKDVFPIIPPGDIVASIGEDFKWAGKRMIDDPVYFVLNACRAYGYLADNQLCSKDEAAVWAVNVLPQEFRGLVIQALETYRGNKKDEYFDESELVRFAAYINQRVEALAMAPCSAQGGRRTS